MNPMEFTLPLDSFGGGGTQGNGQITSTWLLREARTYLTQAEIRDLTHGHPSVRI